MASLASALGRALRVPRARLDVRDPGSFDPVIARAVAPTLDRFCRAWYRLEVRGMERVPDGPALVVGNHNAGITMLEALGVGARWLMERGEGDPWHGLAHDAIVDLPGLGKLLVQLGALRASHESAQRAFAVGRKVVVFPGGNREAFRPWRERHRIAFGDRRGFVRLALRHQVPIVPMVFIGGHDSFVVLRDGQRISRALGADRWLRSDAWPLFVGLPWGLMLGPAFHVPLPVKCVTSFLEPIAVDGWGADAADDPAAVEVVYGQVVAAMQAELDRLAAERGHLATVRELRTAVRRAARATLRGSRR